MMLGDFAGIYCGPPPEPGTLWQDWNLDPFVLFVLIVLGLAVGRRPAGAAAVGLLFVVFVSPLCALTAALFSARVVHHVLLVVIAAPLLAIAWPGRRATAPALPFGLATLILWAWHLPAAYDAALGNMLLYWVMQITLLASAVVMWRAILHRDQTPGPAIFFIFAGFVQMALLGALLTLAPTQLYAIHALAPMAWGLTPLADQQLGGLIMWMPAGLPYMALIWVVARRSWRAMEKLS